MRVSSSLLAYAGFAALVAAPIAAGAQGTPPSTGASITSESLKCDDPKTGATFTANLTSTCTGSGTVSIARDGSTGDFTATAIGAELQGTSASASALFNGTAGDIPVVVSGSGKYFQYIELTGSGIASVVFTSAITASHSSAPDGSSASWTAQLQAGTIGDGGFFDAAAYSHTVHSGSSVDLNVSIGDLGATSFWYSVMGGADVSVALLDPIVSADVTVLDPTVTCFDVTGAPVDCGAKFGPPTTSATPEPASFALMGTGLVGIAGVVRRKRRAAV